MKHDITVGAKETTIRYAELRRGALFRCQKRVSDDNIYMKIGTKAFSLKTGDEYSNDQELEIVPIPKGTKITIISDGDC